MKRPMDDRALLADLFAAAVEAADPKRAIAAHLPERPKGRTVVVGCGKGAAQLAAAFEELWEGPVEGVVVTRYGYACPTRDIRVMEASHPVPDEAGMRATAALLDAVDGLGADDLVVALICGGGSALLPAPAEGLTLDDEIALNEALLRSGAPIGAMNAIRRCASRIKGGGLAAAAAPARVVSLVVSDVPGDDPALVASGPTVPAPGGAADAVAALDTYGIDLPAHLRAVIEAAAPPDPKDAVFERNETYVIASASISLEAAAARAETMGLAAVILSDAIEGEAADVGRVLAAIAGECRVRSRPFAPPVVVLSGGETTVTITGEGGRGGRNSELALSFALASEGREVLLLAADTDGIDGSEDNAGAFADGLSAARMRAAGIDPGMALKGHDAWGAFEASGELFATGPTGTNVNDFRAILVR